MAEIEHDNPDMPLPQMTCYLLKTPHIFHGRETPLYSYSQKLSVESTISYLFHDGWYKGGLKYIRTLEHPVVVDVGAYIGISSLYFAQHKGAQVIALEPSPDSFECLIKNVRGHPNISVTNLALFNGRGLRVITFPKISSVGDSLFFKYVDEPERGQVPAMDIATFMREFKIDHIDLLKINAEGAEYMLFLSEAFREVAPKIDMIVGEAHYDPFPPALVAWLLKREGYDFRWLPIENHAYHWKGTIGAEDFDVTPYLPTVFEARRKV